MTQEPVIFKKFENGEVIALFPEQIDRNNEMMSYMVVGQHSTAPPELEDGLEDATFAEYQKCLKHLIMCGYKNLIVENDQWLSCHRNPTASEIMFGHGATHYKVIHITHMINWKTGNLKKWTKCPQDGLRYYY